VEVQGAVCWTHPLLRKQFQIMLLIMVLSNTTQMQKTEW
jgi:hypothetical protein